MTQRDQPISKMKRHEVERELVNVHGWLPTVVTTWNLAELKVALRAQRKGRNTFRVPA